MTLTCTCGEYDGDSGGWAFIPAEDFVKFEGKRRKRCSSCNELIEIGADSLRFSRWRSPCSIVEEHIYGSDGEVTIAPLHMCEKCGEIYLNLTEAGYCLSPDNDMREHMKDYWEMTGFTPEKDSETPCPIPAEQT